MNQNTANKKLKLSAEDKVKMIARSLAKKIDDIYEQYKLQFELTDNGKIAISIKNVTINTDMQMEIDKQIKLHMELMQEVMDKSIFKEVINAVTTVYKAAGYKTAAQKSAFATV